jgi:hypothetical protein
MNPYWIPVAPPGVFFFFFHLARHDHVESDGLMASERRASAGTRCNEMDASQALRPISKLKQQRAIPNLAAMPR